MSQANFRQITIEAGKTQPPILDTLWLMRWSGFFCDRSVVIEDISGHEKLLSGYYVLAWNQACGRRRLFGPKRKRSTTLSFREAEDGSAEVGVIESGSGGIGPSFRVQERGPAFSVICELRGLGVPLGMKTVKPVPADIKIKIRFLR